MGEARRRGTYEERKAEALRRKGRRAEFARHAPAASDMPTRDQVRRARVISPHMIAAMAAAMATGRRRS